METPQPCVTTASTTISWECTIRRNFEHDRAYSLSKTVPYWQFLEDLTFQTNLHATQKGKTNVKVSVSQLQNYFAVLMYSSVACLGNLRLYWHNVVGLPYVKDALSQREFEAIRTYLHFNNYCERTQNKNDPKFDCFYKVCSFIDHFNRVSSPIPYTRDLAVDKNICATKMTSTMN